MSKETELQKDFFLYIFYNVQWWSLETWSRSRDSSQDPFLRVSVSKMSDLDPKHCVEAFNTATIWLRKLL